MEIELKKIKVFGGMSDETTCFCADVWIDGEEEEKENGK